MLLVPGDAAFCCDQNLLGMPAVFLMAKVIRGPWNGGEPKEPRNHEMFWWGIGLIVTAVCVVAYHVFVQHLRFSYGYLLELAFFLIGAQFVLRSYKTADVTADAAAIAAIIALAVWVVYEVGFGNVLIAGFVLWSLWYFLDL